jgi:hypothetical protein
MILLRHLAALGLVVALGACGDGSTDPVVPAGASVARQAGDGQTVAVATTAATPLAVLIADSNGTTLGGIPVQWSVTSGGGTVTPSSTTGSDGVATASYTAGTTSGPKIITATVPGAVSSPLTFSVTVTPGAAKRLVKTSGDLQSGIINAPLPQPLTVTVVDSFGNGRAGVVVSWTVVSGGGSVFPVTVTTDGFGAAATIYTSGLVAGPATIGAVSGSLAGSPLTFTENTTIGVTLVATIPVPANYGQHDQFIRAGLAFLCEWNTGLKIYDVGDGRAGGSPSSPALISTIVTGGGEVHNAWWYHAPNGQKRYVFVGQEGPGGIGTSSSGDIHVVDITTITNPVEVAFYHLAGAGTHNFWVDEVNEILYAAYYNGGVVALNIAGALSGDLASRVLATTKPGGAGNTYIWGVQLYNGSLYATDMLSGFWQLKLQAGGFITQGGGNNVPERYGSDQWVANGHAYSGTWGTRGLAPGTRGNALKIWQLNGTGAPVLVDSIITAGVGTISDVEVSADNRLLMFSSENGGTAGIHFYSLVTNPGHPTPIGSYPVGTGVHTATFSTINGRRYVFAAKDPSNPAMLILDVTAIGP